jgi:hypothetical protein
MGNVTSVKSRTFGTVDATDADGLSTAATIGSATTLTLNGTLIADSVYTTGANIGQIITILSAADDTGVTFTTVGTDANGDALTEVITGVNAATASSTGYFQTVTSITTDGATTGNVSAGVLGATTATSGEMGTGTVFTGRTRIRGLQGVSAGTAANLDFKNTSVTGTTLFSIPTSTSTTDLIEPYIPDNGILFKAGAYVSFPAGGAAAVTVFYDG